MAVVWYTYEDDGTPTWYSAAAPRANPWRAELARVTRNPSTGSVTTTAAGEVTLSFQSAVQGEFRWRLGSRSGSEPIVARESWPCAHDPRADHARKAMIRGSESGPVPDSGLEKPSGWGCQRL
jgi:hypothetical protein